MNYRGVQRQTVGVGLVGFLTFGILAMLSLFGILPRDYFVASVASLGAIIAGVGVTVLMLHVAGLHFRPAEDRVLSPVRLALGLAAAFAVVSFFEIFI